MISDELSLLSLAEGAGGAFGRDEGAQPPGADNGAGTTYDGAAVTCAPPPGIVSPPAVTVFGGGIGATDGANGADSEANVAHSLEVSESESDPGVPPPAPAPAAPLGSSARDALQ